MSNIKVTLIKSLKDMDPLVWDQCACPEAHGGGRPYDPFTTFRFLFALEESKSVGPGTGWEPHYLIAWQRNSAIGAMPFYLKSHSQGEYIFDHNWAQAYSQAGGHYYPKFQIAVPFTPVSGRRLLVKPGHESSVSEALIGAAKQIAIDNQVSSIHFTFCADCEVELAEKWQMLGRKSLQYHWLNNSYRDFEDFLSNLSSRKRKAIKKERRVALQFGGEISQFSGTDITPNLWDSFWKFYQDTGARKWGVPYLKRSFFDIVQEKMRDDVLLVMAHRDGKYIAGALNFIGRDTLFGRYWGCNEDHSCLHYELCYYQAIDYALSQQLKKVEAGAQGEHKLARGYMPAITNSMHWFLDKKFHSAVERYLNEERSIIHDQYNHILIDGPFKKE